MGTRSGSVGHPLTEVALGALFLLCLPIAMALPTESEVFGGVLARIDQDADGTLTPAEYTRVDDVTPFSALDQDADGRIDLTELTAYVKVTQPRPMDRPVTRSATSAASPPGPGSPPPRAPGAPAALAAPPALVPMPTASAVPQADAFLSPTEMTLGALAVVAAVGIGAVLGSRDRRRRRRRR